MVPLLAIIIHSLYIKSRDDKISIKIMTVHGLHEQNVYKKIIMLQQGNSLGLNPNNIIIIIVLLHVFLETGIPINRCL